MSKKFGFTTNQKAFCKNLEKLYLRKTHIWSKDVLPKRLLIICNNDDRHSSLNMNCLYMQVCRIKKENVFIDYLWMYLAHLNKCEKARGVQCPTSLTSFSTNLNPD